MNDDGALGLEEEPTPPPVVEPADPSASAGRLVREAREAAGVSLDDMATTLKVPVRKLEALEGDRFDQLPDVMFVRALASSVCRALQVDARPILARLPKNERAPFEITGSTLNTPFKGTSSRSRPSAGSALAFLFSPAVLVVLALLAGAAVLLLSPKLPWIDRFLANRNAAAVSANGAASGPVLPPGGVPDDVADTGSRPNSPSSLVTTGPLTPAPSPAVPDAPAVTAAVPPPAPELPKLAPTLTAASAIAAGEASDLVRFEVRAASWIEVADAAGKQPLRRLLSAGESTSVSGKPPLRVIVGRADAVTVTVRGQPLNIEALARDNVARFEVK